MNPEEQAAAAAAMAAADAAAGDESDTGDATDYRAEADKWKSLSRKHEAQSKANAEAARRLATIEEEQKTAEQKAADKAAESDSRATKAESDLARLRVAMRKGLTETQARRLIGATEEEMELDADELLASFRQEESGAKSRPKEKLKSGATSADEAKQSDDPQQRSRDYYASAAAAAK